MRFLLLSYMITYKIGPKPLDLVGTPVEFGGQSWDLVGLSQNRPQGTHPVARLNLTSPEPRLLAATVELRFSWACA